MPNTPDPPDDSDTRQQLAGALAICACFNFRKASRAVTQLYDEALQPSGLRSTQLVILLSAAVYPGLGISQLARNLVMDASTLNRNLRPLLQKELVSLGIGGNGRRKVVGLTTKGHEAIAAAVPLWSAVQTKLVGHFGQERYADLVHQMSALVAMTRGM